MMDRASAMRTLALTPLMKQALDPSLSLKHSSLEANAEHGQTFSPCLERAREIVAGHLGQGEHTRHHH